MPRGRACVYVRAGACRAAAYWAYPAAPNPYGLQPHLAGYVNQIFIQAANPAAVHSAIQQTTEILARRHRIRPGDENDYQDRIRQLIRE